VRAVPNAMQCGVDAAGQLNSMLGFIIHRIVAVISLENSVLTIHNNVIDFDDKRKARIQTQIEKSRGDKLCFAKSH
jgi:hypothetical protein